MDSDKYLNMNFEDALNIAAVCDDLGISRDDAKLFIYIQAKSSNHPLGIQCFTEQKEEEILALEIMLGKKSMATLSKGAKLSEEYTNMLQRFNTFLKDTLCDLDHIARQECGLEYHFHSELAHRLKFHTDKDYMKEKLHIFSTLILPNMKKYGNGKAYAAFELKRKAPPVLIINFRDSIN